MYFIKSLPFAIENYDTLRELENDLDNRFPGYEIITSDIDPNDIEEPEKEINSILELEVPMMVVYIEKMVSCDRFEVIEEFEEIRESLELLISYYTQDFISNLSDEDYDKVSDYHHYFEDIFFMFYEDDDYEEESDDFD